MEWTDVKEDHKVEYYRYIYTMAENYYIKGDKQKAVSILNELPHDYPLRQFLEMSHLYDQGEHSKVLHKIT